MRDPLFRAIGFLARLPGSAQGTGAYFLARVHEVDLVECTSCGDRSEERAAVDRAYRDLGVASGFLLVLGAAGFVRKEAGS